MRRRDLYSMRPREFLYIFDRDSITRIQSYSGRFLVVSIEFQAIFSEKITRESCASSVTYKMLQLCDHDLSCMLRRRQIHDDPS